jgi:hypothetical protein
MAETLDTLKQVKQLDQLTGSVDDLTKLVKKLFKNIQTITKEGNESILDGVKKFEKNHQRFREQNHLDKMKELKDLQKRLSGVEKDIQKQTLEGKKEEFESLIKQQQDYNRRIQRLELRSQAYRIKTNQDFYKKIDDTFKNFNQKTAMIAGKLDSVLGMPLFSSLQKAGAAVAGLSKNALKLTLGGINFAKIWKQEGFKNAFQQTKIGQGIRTAKSKVRKTKIGVRKAITGVRQFVTGGKKEGASERMMAKDKAAELEETQRKSFGVNKKGAKASEGLFSSFTGFFKWFKNWEMMKFAWQILKTGAGAIASMLGFLLPKVLLAPLAALIGKTALGGKFLDSKIGTKLFGRKAGDTVAKSAASRAAKTAAKTVAKKGATGLLKKAALGVTKKLPLVGWAITAFEGIGGALKGWKESKGKPLATRIRDTATSAAGNIVESFSLGLISRKTVQKGLNTVIKGAGFLAKWSPFGILARMTTNAFKKDAEKSKKITEEAKEDIAKKYKGGMAEFRKKLFQGDKEALKDFKEFKDKEKGKTPHIAAASGFPKKTTQPKRLEDLFGKIDKRTNVTVAEAGEPEYLAVLKKDQYEQLKGMLMQQLSPSFLNPLTLAKSVGKATSSVFKALGGAVKNLFGKKSESEKMNQDEDIKKYGGVLSKGAYRLKDQSVDIENLPFKNRLLAMLAERFKLTGKQSQINSGYRSLEDQERVYREMPNRAAKPGRSPHGPPNPRAVDINSTDVADLVELGLIKKYGFKYPTARTKSGQVETWHIQAQQGAAFAHAPKDFLMQGHKGEGAFVAKTKEFESVFKYFEMGKQLAENVMAGKLGMQFDKDIPGRMAQQTQKGATEEETKLTKETVRLLSEIKTELSQTKTDAKEREKQTDRNIPKPSAPAQGGSAGYRQKSEVFPTDVMMTSMYSLITQFSGGY